MTEFLFSYLKKKKKEKKKQKTNKRKKERKKCCFRHYLFATSFPGSLVCAIEVAATRYQIVAAILDCTNQRPRGRDWIYVGGRVV